MKIKNVSGRASGKTMPHSILLGKLLLPNATLQVVDTYQRDAGRERSAAKSTIPNIRKMLVRCSL